MMKNAFYLTLNRKILKCLKTSFSLLGHIEKWLKQKDKVNFKTYDIATWETNNNNTHTVQYLKK